MFITAFSEGKLGNRPSTGKGDSLAIIPDLIKIVAKPVSKVNH